MTLEAIIFLAFGIFVLSFALKRGFLREVPAHTAEIIRDIKAGKFKANRWHLHSLIVFPSVGMTLGFHYLEFLWWVNLIVSLFLTCVIAFTVEWVQRHLGANRTKKEQVESNKDALYTDYVGLLSILITLAALQLWL